jgi:hypothetical protein
MANYCMSNEAELITKVQGEKKYMFYVRVLYCIIEHGRLQNEVT